MSTTTLHGQILLFSTNLHDINDWNINCCFFICLQTVTWREKHRQPTRTGCIWWPARTGPAPENWARCSWKARTVYRRPETWLPCWHFSVRKTIVQHVTNNIVKTFSKYFYCFSTQHFSFELFENTFWQRLPENVLEDFLLTRIARWTRNSYPRKLFKQ